MPGQQYSATVSTRAEAAGLLRELDEASSRIVTDCGDGRHMIWRRWGSGRPVILLHGGAGSWRHWVRNIPFLAAFRTVWVPDLPGFGESDLPEDVQDADSIAPHVLGGLRHLIGDEAPAIVGFSFGGLVAALVAADPDAGIDRLVLVAAAGMGIIDQPLKLRSLRGLTEPGEREEVLRHNLGVMMLHDPGKVDALAVTIQENGIAADRVRGRKLVMTPILQTLAPRWRCRTYGIWGCEDAVYQGRLALLRETTAKLGMRDCTFVEGAGHWVQYERPEATNAILDRYLND